MTRKRQPTPAAYRPGLRRFLIRLLSLSSRESLWLIVAFVLGVIALAVIANFIYESVTDPARLTGESLLRVAAAAVALLGLAYGAFQVDLLLTRRRQGRGNEIDMSRIAPPHAGLIWLLSPGNVHLPQFAIGHHLTGEGEARLRHVWVLITEEAQPTFGELRELAKEMDPSLKVHPYHLDAPTIDATYHAVEDIYATRAQQMELKPEHIIADLTGGFKQMSVGMALACRGPGRSLEYIESKRDLETGLPIEGTQHAVLVGLGIEISA